MPELLDRARAQGGARGDPRQVFRPARIAPARRGAHTMIGVVDASNQASMAFHETLGFELLWLLPEAGRKFDRWLTAAFWVPRARGVPG